MLRYFVFLIILSTTFSSCNTTASEQEAPKDEPAYGPRIIDIDYESLYSQASPPEYKPFEVYGWFLMGVATQQVPLVMNTNFPVPADIVQEKDVIFKEVDGKGIGVDIYYPKDDDTPNPLILIIHGGYWKAGDKSVHVQQAVEFAELGYSVASVNYRLSAGAKFPSNVEDLRDCVLFLTENASKYSIDPNQIVTYGGSAGGHLSAFLSLSANSDRPYTEGINPEAFKGSITLYGMHDLTLRIQREHPFTEQYIGSSYEEDPDSYMDASPVFHVDKNDPPMLLMHGSIDGSVSVKNSDRLSEVLKQNEIEYTYDRIEGWSHAMDFFSPIGERTLWQVHKFLKENMPSDKM